MSKRLLLPLIALFALLAGNAEAAAAQTPLVELELTISHRIAGKTYTQKATLACGETGGTHMSARAACTALAELELPFRPVAPSRKCDRAARRASSALIRGRFLSRTVKLRLVDVAGCGKKQWDELGIVLAPDVITCYLEPPQGDPFLPEPGETARP